MLYLLLLSFLSIAHSIEPPTVPQQTTQSQAAVKQSVPLPVESSIKPTALVQQDLIPVPIDPDVEKKMLMVLCDTSLDIPSDSKVSFQTFCV